MKKILIINGHPNSQSFCHAISEAYKDGASSKGNHAVLLNLSELNFDLSLANGYSKSMELEKDLVFAQDRKSVV